MHAPILTLRHAAIVVPDANQSASTLRLADDADQALQVEVLILAARTNASNLYRQVLLRDSRHVPLPVHIVGYCVHIMPFDITFEFRAGVPKRPAQSPFFTALPRFLRRLVAGPIVEGISSALLGCQTGAMQLFRRRQRPELLAQITRHCRVEARILAGKPEPRAVEARLDHIE
jgi:hypothetical protein